jgi:predicted glycogen debranching enzyme
VIRISVDDATPGGPDREWLETDGQGGYASTTLTGRHTRRYHGLMVANLPVPEGRYVLLSTVEDSLLVGQEELFFTSHQYPGALFPPGGPILSEFILDIGPRFVYGTAHVCLEKTILFVRDTNTILISYRLLKSPQNGVLRLKPLLAFRGYHELMHENTYLRTGVRPAGNGFTVEPYAGMPAVTIRTSSPPRVIPAARWYYRFQYEEEKRRGFDWQEDLFLPAILEVPLAIGDAVVLSASCRDEEDHRSLWRVETSRRQREQAEDGKLAGGFTGDDRELLTALIHAGRQFLITTPSGRPAVIAGYPWFGAWGRDTLISLPGLTFCTGRIDMGIDILSEMGRHEREGLLPNFFSADGKPEAYNTVDSSLLYFRALQELLRITDDWVLIRDRFWPILKRIIRHFTKGTRFGIGMDGRGLLRSGDGRTALTWMDAMVGGLPVTPRNGYAVEINALWYNALCFARDLSKRFSDPEVALDDLAMHTRRSFRETFWKADGDYLGDVFSGTILDPAIRPNQLFAVSLPFSPLADSEQAGVVRKAREHLLTPCGLRTLSPADPDYRGRYRGSSAERDAAYHQGTVWPWLLGPFGEAALKVAADREVEKEHLRIYLRSFLRNHLREAGIGSVSEVFDGDPPHLPGGCTAQAWSVAELIRLFMLLEN